MPVRYTSPPDRADYYIQVWEIVRRIPPGHVMTYGQIAALISCPENMSERGYRAFGPRWVGGALAGCPADVPWWRVVNSQGRISLRGGAEKQREILEEEGVEFNPSGRIDLQVFQYVTQFN